MTVHQLACAYLRAGCCGSQPVREVQMLLSHTTLFSRSSGDPDAFPGLNPSYCTFPSAASGSSKWDISQQTFKGQHLNRSFPASDTVLSPHCSWRAWNMTGSTITGSSGQHLVRVCLTLCPGIQTQLLL